MSTVPNIIPTHFMCSESVFKLKLTTVNHFRILLLGQRLNLGMERGHVMGLTNNCTSIRTIKVNLQLNKGRNWLQLVLSVCLHDQR